MATILDAQILRLRCDAKQDKGKNLIDEVSRKTRAEVWRGSALEIPLGLFQSYVQADPASSVAFDIQNMASVSVRFKESQTSDSATVAEKTVLAANFTANTLDPEDWAAGTSEHLRPALTDEEMNFSTDLFNGQPYRDFWVVVSGLTTESEKVTFGGGTVRVHRPNDEPVGDPPENPGPAISADEALALIAAAGVQNTLAATIPADSATGTVDYTALGLSAPPAFVGVVSATRRGGAGGKIDVWVRRDETDWTTTTAQLQAATDQHDDIIDVRVLVEPAAE